MRISEFTMRVMSFGIIGFAFGGCADQYGDRQALSGAVSFKGKPIPNGYISFDPLDKQTTKSGSMIVAGVYKVTRESGLLPGRYTVRISAGDGKTEAASGNAGPGGSTNIVSKELVPAEWNSKSTKEAAVKKGDKNEFNFDIP